ncbi:MAG: cytochrome b [Chromatiales bacterium]|nr:cytochrome b [Chromatiales bacterium]
MRDTKEKLSGLTIGLHWLVGLVMIGVFIVGKYMEINEAFFLYGPHKSIGILILIAVVARIIWRMKNGWPEPVSNYKKAEQIMAKLVHWILIIGTVLFPVSGIMMSGAGGYGLDIFGLELLANNPDPTNPMEMIPLNSTLAGIGHNMHSMLGKVMIAALALHVIGALKHHIIDKDNNLRRMLGRA